MTDSKALLAPVSLIPGDDERAVEEGIAVCLSGGGYRAMLFHTGALWRLLEAGLLSPGGRVVNSPARSGGSLGTLKRVSSVSGGSIVSALLGLRWSHLDFTAPQALVASYRVVVVEPIRALARMTLASGSAEGAVKVLAAIVLPGSVNEHLARAYDQHLFGGARLSELSRDPLWVVNASNLQSGALWRFMAPAMRDWKVGEYRSTEQVSLAQAVAASSAFPPVLAPATLALNDADFTPNSGGEGDDNLQWPPFTTDVVLADGGVYDNLGLETAYKKYRTLLVSDGGSPFAPEPSVPRNWAGLGKRVIEVIDHQVRALRKRLLIQAMKSGERAGAFWDIDGSESVPTALPCPRDAVLALSRLPTDLGAKDDRTQEQLINWGYAACDASLRAFVDTSLPEPGGFPYPTTGV